MTNSLEGNTFLVSRESLEDGARYPVNKQVLLLILFMTGSGNSILRDFIKHKCNETVHFMSFAPVTLKI